MPACEISAPGQREVDGPLRFRSTLDQHSEANRVSDELEVLVHRLRSGIEREESACRLDGQLRPRLRRFYLAQGFSSTEAEDLVQGALIRVFQHVERLRQEDRFLPWLFTLARNLGRTAVRDRRFRSREQALDPELDAPERDQESAARDARHRLEQVERAMGALPEQQRRCLVLVVRDELSYVEVGDLLGLSPLTVRNHLARARRTLRSALDEEDLER